MKDNSVPEVYFARIGPDFTDSIQKVCRRAFAGLLKDEIVAVKVHFGEKGNTAFIKPHMIRPIVEEIKKTSKPFLTDTNTLYVGQRGNSVNHLNLARAHGFDEIGVPIIIADGMRGKSFIEVDINKKHFRSVKLGAEIVSSDSMVVVSHVKGHMGSGMGAAIKNVGMGSASRAGKQQQHSSIKPSVNSQKCTNCRICGRWCSVAAISYDTGKAKIDHSVCIGCGECTISCPTGALSIRWDSSTKELQEKMAEYAYGAVKGKRVAYVNFLVNIVPDCDCFPKTDKAIVADIGVLASTDIVAIDQASIDLVNQANGISGTRLKDPEAKDKFKSLWDIDATIQIKYAEELGLGSRKYELVEIN